MSDPRILDLSLDRFQTYRAASGFDDHRALALYHWNMRMSGAFFPLIATVEVCFRNRVLVRLEQVYGPVWWSDAPFQALLGSKGKGILLRGVGTIRQRNLSETGGRLTAELSFGFWGNMLLPKYSDVLWRPLAQCFPAVPPEEGIAGLARVCSRVRDLRNRISHHEPIFARNLTQDYSDSLTMLRWVSPAQAGWLKPQLDIMKLLRERP